MQFVPQAQIAADPTWQDSAGESRQLYDLGDLLRSIRERLWLIAACAILGGALGIVFVDRVTPTYWASSRVMLGNSELRLSAGETAALRAEVTDAIIANELAVLGSNILIEQLVIELSLETADEFALAPPPSGLQRLLGWLTGAAEPDAQARRSRDEIIDAIQRRLSVTRIGVSHGIDIGFLSESPEMSALVANTLADLYITARYEHSTQEFARAAKLLEDRTAAWRAEVAKLEADAVSQRDQILELEQSNLAVNDEVLGDIALELNTIRRTRIVLETQVAALTRLIDSDGHGRASGIAETVELARIREHLTNTLILQSEQAASLGPSNAATRTIETQLALIDGLIAESVDQHLIALQDELTVVAEQEAALMAQFEAATRASIALEKGSIELRQLELEAAAARRVYEELLLRLNETRAGQAFGSAGARLIERADVPGAHARPKKTLTVAASLFVGMFVGLAAVLALRLFGGKVHSLRELRHLVRMPVIGVFPRIGFTTRLFKRLGITVLGNSSGEEFRKLRNAVVLGLGGPEDGKSCVLTSATKAAGTTSICIGLAGAFADNGVRALLIDADLRQSTLTDCFKLGDALGFSNILVGDTTLDKAIQRVDLAPFDILPVGTAASQAIDLMRSTVLTDLLAAAGAQYDVILIDTTAWPNTAETAMLARAADRTMLVVDVSTTSRQTVQSIIDGLHGLSIAVIGAIANKTGSTRGEAWRPRVG